MIKPIKALRPEQSHDLALLILELAAKAVVKGEISKEENDGIINFVSQFQAFISVYDERGLIEH